MIEDFDSKELPYSIEDLKDLLEEIRETGGGSLNIVKALYTLTLQVYQHKHSIECLHDQLDDIRGYDENTTN